MARAHKMREEVIVPSENLTQWGPRDRSTATEQKGNSKFAQITNDAKYYAKCNAEEGKPTQS